MAKIYHDTSDSDLKKHADISSAVIRKIKDACEGSSRILDVGCGPFGVLTTLPKKCKKIGVDPLVVEFKKLYNLPKDNK